MLEAKIRFSGIEELFYFSQEVLEMGSKITALWQSKNEIDGWEYYAELEMNEDAIKECEGLGYEFEGVRTI